MKEVYAYQGVGGRVSSRITLRDGVSWFNQSFVWNDLGDLASVSYPSCLLAECESPPGTPIEPSRTVSYNYTNGYLTSVPGFANTISYHPNEMVAQVTHTNAVSDIHDVDPDAMRRPRRIRFAGGGTNHYISGTYLYDGAGNITRTGNDRYLHDKVSRLVSGTVKQFGNTTQTYAYDTYGSLQSITTDGVVRATPTAPSTNRLTGATYDASGNVIQEGTSSYGYDAFNLMVDSTIGGSRRAYVYTADDERIAVATTVPLVGTWKVRDLDGQVLREFREAPSPGANFSWTRDYVRRDGQLLAKVEPAPVDTQHMHLDHLGSVRMVTDGSGSVVSTHHYYPFGEEATASGTEPMKFTGHERDLYGGGSLDLDYMHARYCSPVMGRFLSTDPIDSGRPAAPQTWNRYAYGRNNPLKFVDPDGKDGIARIALNQDIDDLLQGNIDRATFDERVRARGIGAFAATAVVGTAALIPGAGALVTAARVGALRLGFGLSVTSAPAVTDPRLKVVVGQLFKTADRLPGGTAGALRFEALTGRLLSRTGHVQSGLERLGNLRKVIRAGGLDKRDTRVALRLQRDLVNALRMALRRRGFTAEQIARLVNGKALRQSSFRDQVFRYRERTWLSCCFSESPSLVKLWSRRGKSWQGAHWSLMLTFSRIRSRLLLSDCGRRRTRMVCGRYSIWLEEIASSDEED